MFWFSPENPQKSLSMEMNTSEWYVILRHPYKMLYHHYPIPWSMHICQIQTSSFQTDCLSYLIMQVLVTSTSKYEHTQISHSSCPNHRRCWTPFRKLESVSLNAFCAIPCLWQVAFPVTVGSHITGWAYLIELTWDWIGQILYVWLLTALFEMVCPLYCSSLLPLPKRFHKVNTQEKWKQDIRISQTYKTGI